MKKTELKRIELTLQEIWAATRPNLQRNRKKYSRKLKHRGKASARELDR